MAWPSFETYRPYILVAGAIPIVLLIAHELWLWYIEDSQPWGCRKLGRKGNSNFEDEEDDEKYASGADPDAWRIKALQIHPIKSCSAVELDSADVEATGLRYDRQFAFAEWVTPQKPKDAPEDERASRWEFRTLRTVGFERFTLVKPEVWVPDPAVPPSKHEDYVDNMASRGVLIVRYPRLNMSHLETLAVRIGLLSPSRSFRMPLFPPKGHTYQSETVKIWKDSPKWLNYGRHLPDDFKAFIGARNPITLFRADTSSFRQVFRCAPRKEDLGYQPLVGFADAYPLHLINLASVRDLAAKPNVQKELPTFTARRFRPNFLITGPSAYDEDDWKRVRIGDKEYHCACHTVRCLLPNVDPETGNRNKNEPNHTLRSYRIIDPGDSQHACLGLQLVPALQQGTIKVGDKIEVLERGEHFYLKQ